ncbi:16.9 kDa class I heat shock protein 1-like [Amaranthus tricolor]|uniref:16.9 kDa class I heat shock protein 1-like n=1 Tax=Amaranthus tricolor TaxID=29722 RepID=UPI00258AFEAB|nr:16.9 kDa class I heat shock protein 1-like [Amaranthus tricolor]
MAKPIKIQPLLLTTIFVGLLVLPSKGLVPFTSTLWDGLEDPFRILEQTPLPLPLPMPKSNNLNLALLARADWKETQNAHIITLDIPGMKKEDLNIEVEENRVLKVSGERKAEEEQEGDKWHRAERTTGKFWRQFRLPVNADLDNVKAHLEDGVLKIMVPKLAEQKKKQSKVIDIGVDKDKGDSQDLKPTRVDM